MRPLIFKSKSVEKFLRVFIDEDKGEIPQYLIQLEIGSGTFYDAYRHLETLSLVERGVCYDPRKEKEVTCIRLTKKGKKIVDLLKSMYQVLENTGSEASKSSSSSS